MNPYRRLRLTWVGALCIGLLIPGAWASPAAAGRGSLLQLVGPVSASARAAVADGSCPIDYSLGDAGNPEPHQTFRATVWHGKQREVIRISVCWRVNGALGGNSTERGAFRIHSRGGNLSGTVDGLVGFTAVSNVSLHMFVERATGRFRGVTGELTLAGCMDWYQDASRLHHADLAVGPTTAYQYRSYTCTGPDAPPAA